MVKTILVLAVIAVLLFACQKLKAGMKKDDEDK